MSGHTRHQNPAFATVSDTDHTAWIAITTILCIPIILVFGVIRYAVRRTVAFGFDDGFAAAATVRSCDPIQRRLKADSIESIGDCASHRRLERMLLWAGSDGGRCSSEVSCYHTEGMVVMVFRQHTALTALELYYISNLLFLVALASSKASVASLLLRLCAEKRQKLLFVGALASNGLLLMASIFAMALQCDVSQPWMLIGEQCDGVVGKH